MGYRFVSIDKKVDAVKDCLAGVRVPIIAEKYQVDRNSVYIWVRHAEGALQEALTPATERRKLLNDVQSSDGQSLESFDGITKTILEEENRRLWQELTELRHQGFHDA